MYTLDIQTIVDNKSDLYSELTRLGVQDSLTLAKLNQEITTTYTVYSVPFIHYLIVKVGSNRLLEKLTYMSAYSMENHDVQLMIFRFCLKIRDNQQDVYDAEVHHVLYSILENITFSSTIWETELNKLPSRITEQRLDMYDDMMEDYLHDPKEYPNEIHLEKDGMITASARFTLFNVLYASDMRPIRISNDQLFQLSDPTIQLIQDLKKKKDKFIIETHIIEHNLRHSAERQLVLYKSNVIVNDLILDENTVDIMYREYCSLLIHAPKFSHIIALCLIHLSTTKQYSTQMYHKYMMMCQAAWLKIFQSLLNSIVFLNQPLKEDKKVITLSQCCACFIQFHRYTQYSNMNTFDKCIQDMWLDFVKTKSLLPHTKEDDLLWLQNIVMSMTIKNK